MSAAARLFALLACVLVSVVPAPLAAQEPESTPTPTPAPWEPPVLRAEAAILVDLDTDEVLFAKEAGTPRPPASLTKFVTALVVRDLYDLDEIVTVTPEAADTRASQLPMEAGMTFTVRELLYATLLRSSNDAAAALAWHDPAGYDHFIALMNDKARSLGAFSSQFRNPHGLDDDGHLSTPRDMATIGRQLLRDPVLADIMNTERHPWRWPDGRETHIGNSHQLLGSDPTVIGGKTGYTNKAGRCLLTIADGPGGRMLTVVFRSPDHYADTKALLAYAEGLELAPEGGADDLHPAGSGATTLATPPPLPESADAELAAASVGDSDPSRYRWAAFMALLGAGMLMTLHRPRRAHPIEEAAWFHTWMEPLAPRPRR